MAKTSEIKLPWITVNSEPPKPPMFEDLGYVQVVRCKDCKHSEYIIDHGYRCEVWEYSFVLNDGFCNYGALRGEQDG